MGIFKNEFLFDKSYNITYTIYHYDLKIRVLIVVTR